MRNIHEDFLEFLMPLHTSSFKSNKNDDLASSDPRLIPQIHSDKPPLNEGNKKRFRVWIKNKTFRKLSMKWFSRLKLPKWHLLTYIPWNMKFTQVLGIFYKVCLLLCLNPRWFCHLLQSSLKNNKSEGNGAGFSVLLRKNFG